MNRFSIRVVDRHNDRLHGAHPNQNYIRSGASIPRILRAFFIT
jgi:hypothetical protein